MRSVSTDKAFALIFDTVNDLLDMQVELEKMCRELESGVQNLPLSFVLMDESATDADKEHLVERIMKPDVKG